MEKKLQDLEFMDLVESGNGYSEATNDPSNPTKKKKTCAESMLLNPEQRFLTYYDGYMLMIIVYSCVTTAYFTIFEIPKGNLFFYNMEHVGFVSFSLDFIFNLMRQYRDIDGSFVTQHKKIITKYIKSGWFFIDIIATFPYYLLPTDNLIMVKLIRLIRLPRIIRIFNVKSFKKVLTVFVSGDTRSERITSQISVRKVYAIIRLILLAVVICYFVSVLFFFYSQSFN